MFSAFQQAHYNIPPEEPQRGSRSLYKETNKLEETKKTKKHESKLNRDKQLAVLKTVPKNKGKTKDFLYKIREE